MGRRAAIGVLLALTCGACAQVDKAIFDLNLGLAEHVFEPVNKAYVTVVPEPLRKGLRNVTDNLRYTDVMVNNALQGKVDRAASDLGRMTINWICFAGLFDAASDIGIPKYDEDFGQTLGFHGVAAGPYFQVPFIGPTTLRDVWQYPARIVTNPLTWTVDNQVLSYSLSVSTYFFQRFDDVENLDPVREAVDPYAFVREAYLDRREFLIHDGDPPRRDAQVDEEIDAALEGFEDGDAGDAPAPEKAPDADPFALPPGQPPATDADPFALPPADAPADPFALPPADAPADPFALPPADAPADPFALPPADAPADPFALPPAGAAPDGGLPPPRVVRRTGSRPPVASTTRRAPPDAGPRGALPPPVVRPR